MKEIVKFNVSVGDQHRADWQIIARSIVEPMEPISVEIAPSGLVMKFIFYHYPEGLEEVRTILKAQDISSSVWVRREYAKEELLDAEFLNLGTEAVVNSVTGTLRWDLVTLCSYCGFQEPRWDFQSLHVKNQPKGHQLAMVDWHPKVLSRPLADEMRKAGFAGLELIPVGGDSTSAWYGLRALHILPPMASPPTRLHRLPGATPFCERNHSLDWPNSEFYYHSGNFNALDFNCTYEVFGSSESGARAMVISQRVYHLLVGLGVKGLVAEPIRFVG